MNGFSVGHIPVLRRNGRIHEVSLTKVDFQKNFKQLKVSLKTRSMPTD